MKIEGVIFDLDGTLVHTIEDIGDAANAMLHQHGLPEHSTSDYYKWIGNGAAKFIEHSLGFAVTQEQLNGYVMVFKEIYGGNLHNKSRLYEGIGQVLDILTERGIKLSVLSNKPHHLTKKVTEFYLSDWDFNPVFGQREHIPRKPDPAAALEIADRLGIREENIALVGDSQGDLTTAEAAGMVPVGVSWGYGRLESNDQNEPHMIHQPQELLAHLTLD